MQKLFDLKKFGETGYQWKIYDEDDACYEEHVGRVYEPSEFRTNQRGGGLWENGRQVRGTCDYSACETVSGQRRKIKREIAKDND